MELQRRRNSVYNIVYHIVWCTKYRLPVLEGEIAMYLEELLQKIPTEKDFSIEEMKIIPDHIQLFIRVLPTTSFQI